MHKAVQSNSVGLSKVGLFGDFAFRALTLRKKRGGGTKTPNNIGEGKNILN
ncbi:MAG: hypothetical protein ACTSRL_11485 [Candidatus Helarchaeota archaeon]